MSATLSIAKRELCGYFATPVAYVFISVFLALSAALTFYLGNFFARGQADLRAFFQWHPWLYLFFVPAIGMRLWAEERRQGTIELLMTLPIPAALIVIGKFLAAWAFIAIALALTFPLWITVSYLGQPDHGTIAASYIGSLLLAGAFLAIASCLSALTKNQVIAFVLASALCFLLTVAGSPLVLEIFTGWAPEGVVRTIASFSFMAHFQAILRGVLDVTDLVFFVSLILASLFVNTVLVDWKKASWR